MQSYSDEVGVAWIIAFQSQLKTDNKSGEAATYRYVA